MIKHTKINSIPLYYERNLDESTWGDLSKWKAGRFNFDEELYEALEWVFEQVEKFFMFPLGIITAGVQVDKEGEHKFGRAFDLDGIVFQGGLKLRIRDRTKLHAAVMATFMQRFGVVLGWMYDEDHEDHFHVDLSKGWGFRNSRSIVGAVQWFLELDGYAIKIDGIWGPKTQYAFGKHEGLLKLKVYDTLRYPSHDEYGAFLRRIALKFFDEVKRERMIEDGEIEEFPGNDMRRTLKEIRRLVDEALNEEEG